MRSAGQKPMRVPSISSLAKTGMLNEIQATTPGTGKTRTLAVEPMIGEIITNKKTLMNTLDLDGCILGDLVIVLSVARATGMETSPWASNFMVHNSTRVDGLARVGLWLCCHAHLKRPFLKIDQNGAS